MEEYFDVLDERGNYTGRTASRKECHKEGLWHRATVVFILSSDNKRVLLQQRSANKKLWPNLWDMSAGGHLLAGEFSYESAIRETREELGIDITLADMEAIGATSSETFEGPIINRHYNEHYIVHKDIDIADIKMQEEEVQAVEWVDVEDLIQKIQNDYDGLTKKIGCWNFLMKYLEIKKDR